MTGTSREEFAALLRELKVRSGRSYGALAARLHVSTSTLHRYCNGDAVPTDYAPVERLARLCGATTDELVELHRRWLRADALRRTSGAPADEPPEPVTAPVPTAPPVQPKRSFWRRRRPLLLPSAIGASLVLLLAASAVNSDDPPGGTGGERGGGNIAVQQSPDATGSASADSKVSESPASPSPSGEETAPEGKGAQGSPSVTGKPRSGGAGTLDPVAWTADSHVWYAGCGHTYLVGKGPGDVPPPPVEQHAESWARTQGAVHGGNTIIEAVLEPRDGIPVVIRGVHIRVTGRTTPVAWNAYGMSDGCGGALTEAAYTVNLDAERPVARPVDGFDGENALPVAKLPYKISDDDPLALRVEANTEDYDAQWFIDVTWSRGDVTGTTRISDGGEPFRTSSTVGRPAYGFSDDAGWVKEPEA